MTAGLRARFVVLLGSLAILSLPALAQNSAAPRAAPPPSTTPPADTVGPRELQNFSLPGTAARPSEQPATEPAAKPSPQASAKPAPAASRRLPPAPEQSPIQRPARSSELPPATRSLPAAPNPAPPPSQASPTPEPESIAPAIPSIAPAEPVPPPSTPATKPGLPLWPWSLAALALAAAGLFLLWRRKPRESYAGAAHFDLQAPPEPLPLPVPRPQPQPEPRVPPPPPVDPKPAAPSGIVASGLRPSIEIGVQPLRCLIEHDRVTIEFEVELFNSGTAPARAVLAEASLLNAGAMQSQQLADFFANPVGAGERLDALAPMSRVAFSSQVVAQRSAIEEYDLAGRKAFVPVIAFNALYQWGGRNAQTSAAYLVGRETRSDKLAPLHLDGGQPEIRGLGARVLPATVKT